MLSDTIGEQIKVWRKRRGWTREELAAECAKVGMSHLSEAVITNIESGRRTSASRRRLVTVDELVVFAFVLNVPPPALLSPYPDGEEVELFPGHSVLSWVPFVWFAADRSPYHGTYTAPTEEDGAMKFLDAAAPINLVLQHETMMIQRLEAGGRFREVYQYVQEDPDAPDPSQRDASRKYALYGPLQVVEGYDSALLRIREEMRDKGYPLPSLMPHVRYLSNMKSDDFMLSTIRHGGVKTHKAIYDAYIRLVLDGVDEEDEEE